MGLFRELRASAPPAPSARTTPPPTVPQGEACGRCKGTGEANGRSIAAANRREHDKLVAAGMDSGSAWHKVLAVAPKPRKCGTCGGSGKKKRKR